MPHESSPYHNLSDRTIKTRSSYQRQLTPVGKESRTKQSFKKDCDINLIVKRHASTGLWDHLSPVPATFGDFSGSRDLQEAMELVEQAKESFFKLPAAVRTLCENNPVNLLSGLAEPESYEMLVEAGLPGLLSRVAEDPPEAPAAPPAPPEPDPEGS